MFRFLLLFLMTFSANVFAENVKPTSNQVDEFTDIERRIVELSGLLSLSEQVKSSAQHMIALSTIKAGASQGDASNMDATNEYEIVEINHAQHFGIAQSLAKRWGQDEWEKRLLVIVASIDNKAQKKIEKDLSQKRLRSAQKKEKAAISIQTEAEYRLYMNKLKQRPPAASRWKLVEALDNKSGFSQLIIKTREQVYQEISSQVKDWQPPANWQQEAKQEVLEFLFYAYRKTPNPELKKIANSYTPALQSFFTKVKAGL